MPLIENINAKTSTMKISTDSTCSGSANFQSIQNLKTYFRLSEKIFKNIKLKSLLHEGGESLKTKSHKKDFMIVYGSSLINYVGKDITLDMELFNQLEYILMELQQEGEHLAEKLFTKVYDLKNESFLCFKGILKMSKVTLERRVLDWIENNNGSNVEYLAKISANSPMLFRIVSSILYSILVKTNGHWRVLEMTTTFICLVLSVCTKKNKDFLGLYPEDCRHIVSLLLVSPDLYCDEIIKNEVLDLLMKMFLIDRKRTLILLSHYANWLCVFKNHLLKKSVS